MKILSFSVSSYKSFLETSEIELGTGINLFVGHNNSGKSALLYILSNQRTNDPHIDGIHDLEGDRKPTRIDINIEITTEDLVHNAKVTRALSFQFPAMYAPGEISGKTPLGKDKTYDTIRNSKSIIVNIVFSGNAVSVDNNIVIDGSIYRVAGGNSEYTFSVEGNEITPGKVTSLAFVNFAGFIEQIIRNSSFYFRPERLGIGKCPSEYLQQLDSAAQQLPAFLDTLQGSRKTLFDIIVRYTKEILPSVGNVSVGPNKDDPQLREILIWPTENMTDPAFAFPLLSCGTGVSQVLAIISVIVSASPSLIVIDEINNFLHASSIKSLLRIINSAYPHHQYVLSTHSPDVISSSSPSTIHLVSKSGYRSTVQKLDAGALESYLHLGRELGVSISDALVANSIVWIEGPTELLCFPAMAAAAGVSVPQGLVFIPVVHTGDLVGGTPRKKIKLTVELYNRMSEGGVFRGGSAAFAFDNEGLSAKERDEFRDISSGKFFFLRRRNIECYLLDAPALAIYLNKKDSGRTQDFTASDIEQAYADIFPKLMAKHSFSELSSRTEAHEDGTIDGAKIISQIVLKLSESRVEYRKKQCAFDILKARQSLTPSEKRELQEFFEALFSAVATTGPA